MKKAFALLTVLMLLPFAALGEQAPSGVTANAVASCESTHWITAPYAGVLLPFDWETGDMVSAGDKLFALDTYKVYAPANGKVQALFVTAGDRCEGAMQQYGMVASIAKTPSKIISANTSEAYDSAENRAIHIGETVYFYETRDSDNEGEGRVIAVSDKYYTVELTSGDFDLEDNVKLFREEKMGSKSCIGYGRVKCAPDVSVSASGMVASAAVREGQTVKQGQLMLELFPGDADAGVTSGSVTATHAGALEVKVMSGQQVYKGQALAVIHDLTAMNVVAEVDEMDLDRVSVGGTVTVVFDRYPGKQFSGVVREISRMGVAKQNATYYDVTISCSGGVEVLPGMNATVYLP